VIEHQPWDPVGQYINELADDAAVAAIVGANPTGRPRVRGQRAGPGDTPDTDRGEAAQLRAYIVITTLATPPHPQVPVQRPRHNVRCYGRDDEEADRLYRAASAVLHRAGPRTTGSRQAIYITHDVTGATRGEDPATKQPYYDFIVESVATTQVLA
jgi:hypothetical protein